jgi:hypothetical protein
MAIIIGINARILLNLWLTNRQSMESVTPLDIIAINETWTHKNPEKPITDSYLHMQNYTIIGRHDRTDTKDGRGGGFLFILLYPQCVSKPNIQ